MAIRPRGIFLFYIVIPMIEYWCYEGFAMGVEMTAGKELLLNLEDNEWPYTSVIVGIVSFLFAFFSKLYADISLYWRFMRIWLTLIIYLCQRMLEVQADTG